MRTPALKGRLPFFRRSFLAWTIAKFIHLYISGGVRLRIFFVGKLADEAYIFLDLLSLLFHFSDIVLATLLLQSLQDLLVLLYDL